MKFHVSLEKKEMYMHEVLGVIRAFCLSEFQSHNQILQICILLVNGIVLIYKYMHTL